MESDITIRGLEHIPNRQFETLCLHMPVCVGLVLSVSARLDYGTLDSIRLFRTDGPEWVEVDEEAFGEEMPYVRSFEELNTYMALAKAYAYRMGLSQFDF